MYWAAPSRYINSARVINEAGLEGAASIHGDLYGYVWL